ncbi:MAG: tetratricopeptide repeat protein [Brevinematia bacterium]
MLRISFFLTFLFFLSCCSSYYKFDEAYDKRDFLKAYNILETIKKKEDIHYKVRNYRIILRLSLEGDEDFILKLSNLTLNNNEIEEALIPYRNFGISFLSYLNARTAEDYSNTLHLIKDIKNVPSEFESYFYKIKGISEYKTGNYEKALFYLSTSLKMNSSSDALYFSGMCYLNQRKFKEAKGYFEKILSSTLDNFFNGLAYFQIAEIYYEEGTYKEAMKYYIKALETYPEIPQFAFKLSKCLNKLNFKFFAEKFLKVAIRINKDYATAWFYLNIN